MAEAQQDLAKKVCPNCRREYEQEQSQRLCPFDDSLLAPVIHDEMIGTIIDNKLEVRSRISQGGWGSVYTAHHKTLDQVVAVKVLHHEFVSDLDRVARFQREAHAISSLRNPHVITVLDYGMLPNGRPYLVMEFLNGESLSGFIAREGTLKLPIVLDIFMQVCDALAAAHKKGIVHRDIKPGNIMYYDEGGGVYQAKILDFGLARLMNIERSLTKSGETLGSPSYMSPEQCRGGHIDGRSDIYSLGCVMYEVLCGERAFEGSSTVDCMSKHLFAHAKPFSQTKRGKHLPKVLEQLVMTCLQKDPGNRYHNMEELRAAIGDALLISVGGDLPVPTSVQAEKPEMTKLLNRMATNTGRTCLFLYELVRVLKNAYKQAG